MVTSSAASLCYDTIVYPTSCISPTIRLGQRMAFFKCLFTYLMTALIVARLTHLLHNVAHVKAVIYLLVTTQAWKQTLPPSDRTLYYTSASYCKYLSCKICFNVLIYVFILFIVNL